MSIFYRIDDRLIHGQVITSWSRYYDLKEIIIIDDQVVVDPIQRKIIEMVAPPNITVHLTDTKKSVDKINAVKDNTLVLTKGPKVLLYLIEQGVQIDEIIVGGMQYRDGKKKISSSVSISNEEREDFIKLSEKGVEIAIQIIPTEKKKQFKNF